MQDKSLLEKLPIDVVSHVSSFLDHKSIVAASNGSKAFNGLFNTPSIWKDRLIKSFNIDGQLLVTTFPNEIKNNTLNYKKLYMNFHSLSQQPSLPKFIKSIYLDKTQHHLVLLACTDNDTHLKNIPREQQYLIAVLAIYAGCSNTPYSFLENHLDKDLSENLLAHAASSGYLQLVQHLLKPNNTFGLKPNRHTLNQAASSGNIKLVQYLLNPDNKFGLNSDAKTLSQAAHSGNLQLVKYLLEVDNKYGLKPDKNALDGAAESGNLPLMQYLLNPENKFLLKPINYTLKCAAISGNSKLIQYLLNAENKFGLKPDKNTLNCAAISGNLQLVQYLSNAENKFGLTPDKETLSGAALSGNLELVQYLLNQKIIPDKKILDIATYGSLQLVQYLQNQFHLTPDHDTLNSAAKSGNLQLVQYLLNPDNQFGLKATKLLLDSPTSNFASSRYLLPSDFAFQDALEKLQAHDITAAKILLEQSHSACPSHYKRMLHYIVNNPQRFNLSESAKQCLQEHVDTLLANEKMSTGVSLNF